MTGRKLTSVLATVAGVLCLIALNYYLRHTLETADQYMYSFYRYFYPADEKIIFSQATPWWMLLLPIPRFTGVWNTTTLVLMRLLEPYLRPATEWYLCNAILIVCSFWVSWVTFRSRVFSYTLAICLAFGTQLYITYPNSGTISFPLLFVYYELLLFCVYKLIVADDRRWLWKLLFVPAMLATALAYEQWLDLLVFSLLASVYLYVIFGRMHQPVFRRRLVVVAATMTAIGIIYVVIKITFGYGQQRGMESDVVFNYPFIAPVIEDVLSNALTNFYMVATNFLPPIFVSSTAFYQLGGEQLVQLQHGYHAPFSYLVPMHYMFLWRYYAGIAATVFLLILARVIRRSWTAPSVDGVVLAVFLLMMGVGGEGPTHSLIKFRPMNSMPVQTYHVMTGVLGASLVISLLTMWAWMRWRHRWAAGTTVAAVWAVLFYGALARPGMISHQAAQSGLGVQVYPNPLAKLVTQMGWTYHLPGGLALYQLAKYTPAATPGVPPPAAPPPVVAAPPPPAPPVPPPPFGVALDPMPNRLTGIERWTKYSGVTVTAAGGAVVVHGNDTKSGYQILSPEIAVPSGHRLFVRVRGTVEQGSVCVGILDEGQRQWLLAPAPDRTRLEYSAYTGANRHVSIAFANCNSGPDTANKIATAFTLESVTYGVVQNVGEVAR